MSQFRPGRLRHRARLQAPTAANSDGEVTNTFATQATRRCRYEPISGRERWFADQADSIVTGKIVMRYYAGMDTSWRIVLLDAAGDPDRTFHIDAILDLDETGRWLELSVIETDEPGSGSSP